MHPQIRFNHIIVVFVFLMSVTLYFGCSRDPVSPEEVTGTSPPSGSLRTETVTAGLTAPWDLAWGPDGSIWVTERGGSISRVDTASGKVTQIGQVNTVQISESGLMGMAFHPDFTSQPYVYVVYSYESGEGIRNRLVRMAYDGAMLGGEVILLDDVPGANIHNGSRLAVGPDGFLYMTMGDAGNSSSAQDISSFAGKILRLTLNGSPAPGNPFGSPVYSFGHRNPQGIVFQPGTGALYITEHGPSDNDEVNRVEKGRNYGWPEVRGFCDGDVANEEAFCDSNDIGEPVAVWTPTVAPSGADFYNSDLIPGWKGSLLFTTLKGSALYRLTLSGDGSRTTAQEIHFRGQFGRLRDVLVGPRGEVYLATSNRDGRGNPAADDDRIIRIQP